MSPKLATDLKRTGSGRPVLRWHDSTNLRMLSVIFAVVLLTIGATAVVAESLSAATNLTVDSVEDDVDTNPGDGVCASSGGLCTLRAAIQESNALPGADTIILPSGAYLLSVTGPPEEDAGASGDLDITDDLTIEGGGASTTIVDAQLIDRVFHILNSASVTINGLTITGGESAGVGTTGEGGGVWAWVGSALLLEEVVVAGNKADSSGGGISAPLAELTVIDSTIVLNETGMANGGISSSGSLVLDGSTVAFNLSADHGGVTISGDAFIVNSTVSGNVAVDGRAGGIALFGNGVTQINNTTITDNAALTAGGGIYRGSGSPRVEIANSIIAENVATVGPNCSALIDSFDHNLFGDLSGCTVQGQTTHNQQGVDPMLGPLDDNGGPTPTHALDRHSPAIDSGNPTAPGSGGSACESHDQTGRLRPEGAACDVGAFESTLTDTFTDDDNSTFEADIEWLAAEGITKGCNPPANTLYCPDEFVTRGQMAAFLVRAMGYTDNGGGNLFIDDNGDTFENDIDKLGTAGVTKGCNPPANDRYCPNDFVTRGQMAAFLVRALGYTDNGGGNLFIDDNGHTFENDIDKLGTAGVTKGCNPPTNDRFCPNDLVTRGQMAAFLHRALG